MTAILAWKSILLNDLTMGTALRTMTLDAAENRCAVSKVIRKYKETEEVIPRLQDAIFEMTFAQHFLPDRDQVEKLLRYETATERSLDRALDRLERLQRRRLGEPGVRAMLPHMTQ